jgi:hypothetical protein
MFSALRSAALFAFVSAIAVLTVPGCSQQGEGERCDSNKNGDEDCDSGLTCVSENLLLERTSDRCCPAEGTETDRRCNRGVPNSPQSMAGTSSGGTSSGGTSSGGAENGGAGATGAESTVGGDMAGVGGDTAGVGGDTAGGDTAGAGGDTASAGGAG